MASSQAAAVVGLEATRRMEAAEPLGKFGLPTFSPRRSRQLDRFRSVDRRQKYQPKREQDRSVWQVRSAGFCPWTWPAH